MKWSVGEKHANRPANASTHGAELVEVRSVQGWRGCDYNKSSSVQSSESVDLRADANQEVLVMESESVELYSEPHIRSAVGSLTRVHSQSRMCAVYSILWFTYTLGK